MGIVFWGKNIQEFCQLGIQYTYLELMILISIWKTLRDATGKKKKTTQSKTIRLFLIQPRFPKPRPQKASLEVQWLRIRLPMQGTRVWALVWEDPTYRGATKPVCHNYWACALEPTSHNYWACVPQLLKPARLEPVLRNKRSHRNEKPTYCNKE